MSAKKTPTNNAKAPKKAKPEAPAKAKKAKKVSALDAAAKVLGDAGSPMNCKELIEVMAKKGLWTSPGGKTPHATLYSAILREVTTKVVGEWPVFGTQLFLRGFGLLRVPSQVQALEVLGPLKRR